MSDEATTPEHPTVDPPVPPAPTAADADAPVAAPPPPREDAARRRWLLPLAGVGLLLGGGLIGAGVTALLVDHDGDRPPRAEWRRPGTWDDRWGHGGWDRGPGPGPWGPRGEGRREGPRGMDRWPGRDRDEGKRGSDDRGTTSTTQSDQGATPGN